MTNKSPCFLCSACLVALANGAAASAPASAAGRASAACWAPQNQLSAWRRTTCSPRVRQEGGPVDRREDAVLLPDSAVTPVPFCEQLGCRWRLHNCVVSRSFLLLLLLRGLCGGLWLPRGDGGYRPIPRLCQELACRAAAASPTCRQQRTERILKPGSAADTTPPPPASQMRHHSLLPAWTLFY